MKGLSFFFAFALSSLLFANSEVQPLRLELGPRVKGQIDISALNEINFQASRTTPQELDQNLEMYLLSMENAGLFADLHRSTLYTAGRSEHVCSALHGTVQKEVIQSLIRISGRASLAIHEHAGTISWFFSPKVGTLRRNWHCIFAMQSQRFGINNLEACAEALQEELRISKEEALQLNSQFLVAFRGVVLMGALQNNILEIPDFLAVKKEYQDLLQLTSTFEFSEISRSFTPTLKMVAFKYLSRQVLDNPESSHQKGLPEVIRVYNDHEKIKMRPSCAQLN